MTVNPNLMQIRTINADQAGAIAETGRPAGRWIWREDGKRGLWRGAIADGRFAEIMQGSFPTVLTRMMICAGLVKKTGRAPVVNASRDPEWRVAVNFDHGVRIPGAKIRKWENPVTVTELPPHALTVNTDRASEMRAAEAEAAEEKPAKPRGHRRPGNVGRPAGATGETVGTRILRERLVEMVCAGLTDREIAERVRLALDTVQKHINNLRREGAFPNDRLPAWRVRRFRQTERRRPNLTPDKAALIRKLRAAGLTYSEIAERTDTLVSVVASRCRDVKAGEAEA